MADDPFSLAGDDSSQDGEFFRGLNFLGRPSSITLPGQEPSPLGGALSAGGPSPNAPSPTGSPGPGAATQGVSPFGLSPGLQALMTGLSFAERGSNLSGLFAGAPTAGAFQTPSGQLTTGAPEILRDIQFPGSDVSPAGQAIATQDINSSLFGDLGQYISSAAPYLSGAGSILDIIQALRSGNPAGVVGPAGQLGVLGAGELGLIPTAASAGGEAALGGLGAAAGAGAAGLPIGMAVNVLAATIADMIQDPRGRRSAAEDVNFLESQQVPRDVQALGAGAGLLPFVSNPQNLVGLSNEQLIQMYGVAAGGIRASDYLADPLAQAGTTEAGITHPSFPGLSEFSLQSRPESIQATLLLDQELARRGIDPSSVTVGASGDPTGAYRLAWEKLHAEMFAGGTPQQGEFTDAGGVFGQQQQILQNLAALENQSIFLDPATLQGMLGPSSGVFAPPPQQTASAPAIGGDLGASPFGAGTIFPFEQA